MQQEIKYYYYAPIATNEYNAATGIQCQVAAAANKVLGVASALATQRRTMEVVSCPITTAQPGVNIFPRLTLYADGVRIIFLRSISVRGLNRLVAALEYLLFTITKVDRKDNVILYNFFPEYILSALYLFVCQTRAHLDIEDAPRKDEKGLRGISNRISYRILSALCSERKITAAHMIGERLKLENYLSVSSIQTGGGEKAVLQKLPIRVLFGGAMMLETGVELFCKTLIQLAATPFGRDYNFVITGFGNFDSIIRLKRQTASTLSIDLKLDCTPDEYRMELSQADIGLSLKIPSSGIGETTFPSKSIEISANGLLLITTKVSDIPLIFDSSTAILLEKETPADLLKAFIKISENRAYFSEIAEAGQKLVTRRFGAHVVGAQIVDFLEIRA